MMMPGERERNELAIWRDCHTRADWTLRALERIGAVIHVYQDKAIIELPDLRWSKRGVKLESDEPTRYELRLVQHDGKAPLPGMERTGPLWDNQG